MHDGTKTISRHKSSKRNCFFLKSKPHLIDQSVPAPCTVSVRRSFQIFFWWAYKRPASSRFFFFARCR